MQEGGERGEEEGRERGRKDEGREKLMGEKEGRRYTELETTQ